MDTLLIDIALIALLLFGVLHFSLGIIWNGQRFKQTFKYSAKYRCIWLVGLLEVLVAIILMVTRLSYY